MDWNSLTDDAKLTIKGMVEYCIENELCMGMAGGKILGETEADDRPDEIRAQLERFAKIDE